MSVPAFGSGACQMCETTERNEAQASIAVTLIWVEC
jgi:hypothetical protein